MTNDVSQWRDRIALCLGTDRGPLKRQLDKIGRRAAQDKPFDREMRAFLARLEKSSQRYQARRASVPSLTYPEDLPIAARREDLRKAIADHQVVIVAGETGSGKTTQLPKICLELGRGVAGMIGHTQPRRIAARTVANRIAEELQQPLGETVGYQVRFSEQIGDNTLVKLMTDGILLADIQNDRLLHRYDTLIIDEAHERSLNIDFLLGYLKNILPQRPDLKVVITSATIDVERFSQHFDDAPIIEVSGRTYPVDVEYRPTEEDRDLSLQVLDTVEEILSLPKRGDILVFLSGEREIRETANLLRKAQLPHLEVVPLYARLSLSEQGRVFQPHNGVRVVLATNVAETSLTVPGIRYVIDPGTARISRYSYRTKVQRLPIEPVSQASANQRKGRCGRVSEGVCFRLYSEADFNNRPAYTDPEIVRTNLASVILQMLQLKIGDIRDFPFVEAPDQRLINDGFSLLQELHAVTLQGELTETGRQLSRIPADPRLGRMLLAAGKEGALRELLVIVSALSVQDPRERPADKQQAADEKHRQWQDKHSDFTALLNLWNTMEAQRQALSRNPFDRYCRQQFVSPLRIREWRDLHHQLHRYCRELKLPENRDPADYPAIHRALLTGLLGQVGFRHDDREFLGPRNRKFHVFPASGLFKKPPKWLMAAEIIETSKLYSHVNAAIEPEWLQELAAHLVKKSYSEPHYSARRGQVMAFEQQTLYGLPILTRKPCNYSAIDPSVCRDIFIRAALVEGEYRGKGAFFDHNQAMQENLEDMESRIRRRDVLVDDEVMYQFYQERLPPHIVNLKGFEKWRTEAEKKDPKLLWMDESLLIQRELDEDLETQYPDHLEWQGTAYPLSYHFEPGHPEDGVSVTVPVSILHQLPNYRFEWLVPGMLRDKCIALIKGLPKSLRRHFVPVPGFVDKALAGLKADDFPLAESLGQQLKRLSGVTVADGQWQQVELEPIYSVNIRLTDEQGELLAMGRNLTELKATYRGRVSQTINESSVDSIEKKDLSGWTFDELPTSFTIRQQGLAIRTYPALVCDGNWVDLKLLDNPARAANETVRGLLKLYQLSYPQGVKYLRKTLLKGCDLSLKAAHFLSREQLLGSLIDAAYYRSLIEGNAVPRNRQAFEQQLLEGRAEIAGAALQLEQLLLSCLPLRADIYRAIKKLGLVALHAATDINRQVDGLFCDDFLLDVPAEWLQQYPRYLKAILLRLEKLPGQPEKDRQSVQQLAKLEEHLYPCFSNWRDLASDVRKEVWQHYFMLQEYRVSLFAQQLGTRVPVSEKRITAHWLELQSMLAGT